MKHRIVLSAFLALALGAGAADWFDAGISDYVQWPSDGSDFLVPGAGSPEGLTPLVEEEWWSRGYGDAAERQHDRGDQAT